MMWSCGGEVSVKMCTQICRTLVLMFVLSILVLSSNADSTHPKGCKDLSEGSTCVSDTLGFEAVKQLHDLIDDDHNGDLDRVESNEFFREELKHEDGTARLDTFHGSDDHISINDLWKLWTISEVYNWTVEDTILWLEDDVGLPKYAESFRVNEVDGHILPRIAVNSQYVTSILGIKNPVHRQKLSVKATDLVLFGYKKRGHNWIKDLLFVLLLGIALTVAWLARRENKASQTHIRKVITELESLQRSEDTLRTLQKEYEETKREHQETAQAKQTLEHKLEAEATAAKKEAERLRTTREATEEEISRLKLAELELIEVRKALAESERRIEQMTSEIPHLFELQQWLQLTYEIESQYYESKKEAAERHLMTAREMCERIRKKRGGLLGSLRVAHSTSMDDTDHSIMKARDALEKVRLYFQERNQRWQEVERICGFDIIQNVGLHVLETTLRGVGGTYLAGNTLPKSASVSSFATVAGLPIESDLDEDLTSAQLAAVSLLSGSSSSLSSISQSLRSNDPSNYVPKVYSGGNINRHYHDRRVWPNLMKAGMQLTMFGLGLSHPQLGAVHPGGTEAPDKRKTLVDVFGAGTSRSLGRHSRTVPQGLTRTDTSSSLMSEDNGSVLGAAAATTSTDPVKFGLGELRASPTSENGQTSNAAYVKSKSLEASSSSVQPKTLSTSLSDSSLLPTKSAPHSTTVKRTAATKPTESPSVIEEESSYGSTESLETSHNGKEKNGKKNSLKTLFKPKKKKDS